MTSPALQYCPASRDELASHLAANDVSQAEACNGVNIYRCLSLTADRHETLVITLPDGNGLIIEQTRQPAPLDRRRKPG